MTTFPMTRHLAFALQQRLQMWLRTRTKRRLDLTIHTTDALADDVGLNSTDWPPAFKAASARDTADALYLKTLQGRGIR